MSRRRQLSLVDTVSEEPDDLPMPSAGTASKAAGVVEGLTGANVSTPVTVDHVPAPYAASPEPALSDRERADLETCERAVSGLQTAFVVAGKALATINQARLYKETHRSFAAYVEERWGMRKSQAYRLIEAWPVAVALASPQGDGELSPRGDSFDPPPEKHVRALLPVVKQHGIAAARAVYDEIQQHDGRVTTSRVTEAVRLLPRRLADPEQARELVRAAVIEGRISAPRVGHPVEAEQPQAAPDGDMSREQVDAGAEAIATMERAVAQQRQIYDAVTPDVREAALLYDPGRGEMLRRELRQYANRTAYRMRGTHAEEGEDGSS